MKKTSVFLYLAFLLLTAGCGEGQFKANRTQYMEDKDFSGAVDTYEVPYTANNDPRVEAAKREMVRDIKQLSPEEQRTIEFSESIKKVVVNFYNPQKAQTQYQPTNYSAKIHFEVNGVTSIVSFTGAIDRSGNRISLKASSGYPNSVYQLSGLCDGVHCAQSFELNVTYNVRGQKPVATKIYGRGYYVDISVQKSRFEDYENKPQSVLEQIKKFNSSVMWVTRYTIPFGKAMYQNDIYTLTSPKDIQDKAKIKVETKKQKPKDKPHDSTQAPTRPTQKDDSKTDDKAPTDASAKKATSTDAEVDAEELKKQFLENPESVPLTYWFSMEGESKLPGINTTPGNLDAVIKGDDTDKPAAAQLTGNATQSDDMSFVLELDDAPAPKAPVVKNKNNPDGVTTDRAEKNRTEIALDAKRILSKEEKAELEREKERERKREEAEREREQADLAIQLLKQKEEAERRKALEDEARKKAEKDKAAAHTPAKPEEPRKQIEEPTVVPPSEFKGETPLAFIRSFYDIKHKSTSRDDITKEDYIDDFESNLKLKFVQERVEKLKNYSSLQMFLQSARLFTPYIEKIYSYFDVAGQSVYNTFLESAYFVSGKYLIQRASNARESAYGPGQFVLGTGKNFGLIYKGLDQRANFIPTACASAKYLKKMSDTFNYSDLTMSLLAYKLGELTIKNIFSCMNKEHKLGVAQCGQIAIQCVKGNYGLVKRKYNVTCGEFKNKLSTAGEIVLKYDYTLAQVYNNNMLDQVAGDGDSDLNYIGKFLAVYQIMGNPEKYGYSVEARPSGEFPDLPKQARAFPNGDPSLMHPDCQNALK